MRSRNYSQRAQIIYHEPGENGVEDGIEDGVEIVEDTGHHEQHMLKPLHPRGPTRSGNKF